MRAMPFLLATLRAFAALAPTGASSGAAPDLVVTSVSHEQPSSHNQSISVWVTVQNQGNASAAAFTLGLSIPTGNMSFETSYRLAGLAAGASQTFRYDLTTIEGEHDVHAVADLWSEVSESNETNNVRVSTLRVDSPDLTPRDIWMTPTDPLPGEKVFFHATVANWGQGYATDTDVRFAFMNGATFSDKTIPYIGGGHGSVDTTSYPILWSGSVTVCVLVENPDEPRLGATNGRCEPFSSELPL